MSTDQRFSLLFAALTLIFLVMSALLGFVVRVAIRWTRTEDKLGILVDEVRELVARKENDHDKIRHEADEKERRGDREHYEMRERLTWLERRELQQRREKD